ncbi:hypothetical protein [Nonomuraea turkmeniaca]|uniref:hypothetical protein n=1 Tax=Nonomuraea turkmeniaca TaxID=103838 RepID=UPI001FE4DD74|nr:hypothetical protein [Nonomuraea turkmeniaca]
MDSVSFIATLETMPSRLSWRSSLPEASGRLDVASSSWLVRSIVSFSALTEPSLQLLAPMVSAVGPH